MSSQIGICIFKTNNWLQVKVTHHYNIEISCGILNLLLNSLIKLIHVLMLQDWLISSKELLKVKPTAFALTSETMKSTWDFVNIKFPEIIRFVVVRFWTCRAVLEDNFVSLRFELDSSIHKEVLDLHCRKLEEFWCKSLITLAWFRSKEFINLISILMSGCKLSF